MPCEDYKTMPHGEGEQFYTEDATGAVKSFLLFEDEHRWFAAARESGHLLRRT